MQAVGSVNLVWMKSKYLSRHILDYTPVTLHFCAVLKPNILYMLVCQDTILTDKFVHGFDLIYGFVGFNAISYVLCNWCMDWEKEAITQFLFYLIS